MKNFRLALLAAALLLICASESLSADSALVVRVRIAECSNPPPIQLFLLKLSESLTRLGKEPPAWQTLPAATEDDIRNSSMASVVGTYDMVFTSDEEYKRRLEESGILRKSLPILEEELILVGPDVYFEEFSGADAGAVMQKIFSEERTFFSLVRNRWALASQRNLLAEAGVKNPSLNKNYVDSGKDDLGALIQAGDEDAFMLVGEASFAQYQDSQRGMPMLRVLARTGIRRRCYVALISNMGFRKMRSETADKYFDWLAGDEGLSAIESFELGGMSPFRAVR
jgi:ABC-type tungstate transport system permease subunit